MLVWFLVALSLWSPEEGRTTKKAVMLSLALPGLGEMYMGEKDDAMRAFAIEGGIILSYLGLEKYANIVKDDYIKYGIKHSGMSSERDEDYYDAVEWYQSCESYNISVREEARWLFPDNRERQLEYIRENEIQKEKGWCWQESEWATFRALRKGERKAHMNASYCIGLGIVNRVISAIISSRLGKERKLNLYIEPQGVRFSYAF